MQISLDTFYAPSLHCALYAAGVSIPPPSTQPNAFTLGQAVWLLQQTLNSEAGSLCLLIQEGESGREMALAEKGGVARTSPYKPSGQNLALQEKKCSVDTSPERK